MGEGDEIRRREEGEGEDRRGFCFKSLLNELLSGEARSFSHDHPNARKKDTLINKRSFEDMSWPKKNQSTLTSSPLPMSAGSGP